MKKFLLLLTLVAFLMVPAAATASQIIGGDAASQAAADDILDIIFLIDVSGSMYDDISAIGGVAQTVIQNLECPDCDVYVRATFAGIQYPAPSYRDPNGVFNEAFRGPTTNHVEDNGPAAMDAVNSASGSWWVDDATAEQDYYRAVVTIGDEGTQNGSPVYQDDYDAGYAANAAAVDAGVFLFTWVTDDPWNAQVGPLFNVMATGGTLGGHTFLDTGGAFIDDTAGTGNVADTLEQIICTAGSGGTGNNVPEPGTMILLGTGLIGLVYTNRKRIK